MAYPFVPAYHDYGPRKGPVRAFVVHMAEGGGTVGFLSRPTARGVSVHYVIEYSGRIVQMLREDHASGSIDPTKLRTTNGPAPYGATVRKRVMGAWDSDPNSAVISLEIEGFARDGPNAAQLQALARLVDDVRSRYPAMGLLGHRDFADYKACPGSHIPWTILGGHGPAAEDDDMQPFPVGVDPKIVDIRVGAQLYNLDLSTTGAPTVVRGDNKPSPYTYRTRGVNYRVVQVSSGGVPYLWLVKLADVTASDPVPAPAPPTAALLAPGIYEVR